MEQNPQSPTSGLTISDEELKEQVQSGVEVIDLNSTRDQVKPTTWHIM